MKRSNCRMLFLIASLPAIALPAGALADNRVRTADGIVEGITDQRSGIRVFKGIPFAEPPVGDLRWKPPQPVKSWKGVRRADKFGPRATQPPIYGDMHSRSEGMSENCLYLNVWTPATSGRERLPVLVYFYGGAFVAGDGSQPCYDGESMARRGIVAVTVNYRLNVFGFLAHPELTRESPHHASGNYGLLDQNAALRWVQRHIAAFGGDPKRVTIAGESAGSISVCAQMVSPLSKGLIAGAIGESGAMIEPTQSPDALAEAEQIGVQFWTAIGATSLAALRAMPAEQILDAAAKGNPYRFGPAVDNYFLPKLPVELFAAGEQARVPLLVGWNSEEVGYWTLMGRDRPTPESFAKVVRKQYGDRADEALKLYPDSTAEEAMQSATDLANDQFIAYSTWKWFDLHRKTGGKPTYRYLYCHPRPGEHGAVHTAEIDYALGNLATDHAFAWTPDDYRVSAIMQGYFANFVKTGDPNGPGLPHWPVAGRSDPVQVMRLDVDSHAEPERHRDRYLFLDPFYTKSH